MKVLKITLDGGTLEIVIDANPRDVNHQNFLDNIETSQKRDEVLQVIVNRTDNGLTIKIKPRPYHLT